MNISKIKIGKVPDAVSVVIEIPYKSNIKYELDKDSDCVMVDRVLHASMFYPANYGFIPHTLGNDGDPTDVLVLNENSFQAGSVIKCRIVGMLHTEDESGVDEKILAVAISKVDPTYDDIRDIDDIGKMTKEKIKHFFERYKDLEPNKWVKVQGFDNKEVATKVIQEAIAKFNK
jgi:inorganic pyrophosphatase